MKDNYIKCKKKVRSLLGLGTTISLIGIYSMFSRYFVFGAISFVIGLIILFLCYKNKKETINIENYSLKQCPVCGKETTKVIETRYYIGSTIVTEDVFNNSKSLDKVIREIEYYKCVESKFCLTKINSYLIRGNKKKPLQSKINMDFNFDNSY